MKIATLIIRTLIGLLLLFASISFFLKLVPEPVTTGDFKAFQVGLIALTYLMPLAKGIELLCGLAYVTNKFVTLARKPSYRIVCFSWKPIYDLQTLGQLQTFV